MQNRICRAVGHSLSGGCEQDATVSLTILGRRLNLYISGGTFVQVASEKVETHHCQQQSKFGDKAQNLIQIREH